MRFAWRGHGACGSIAAVTSENAQHRQITRPISGRDELNLIDFPISLLQHQQPANSDGSRPDELVCTIESYDRHLERVVPRKLTRRTSSQHGFPTSLEDEVLIALLTLTRLKNEFKSARVNFKNSELWALMGWPVNGNSSRRLSISLDRLKGLTLKYENAWTTGGDRFKKEFTTGLLDSYQLVSCAAAGSDGETSWIQWSSEVFSDIQNGNVKELDTERFFSLRRPISKRLYRFLDKHLSESRHFEMDLLTLAAHMGISETKHIGKIKERLRPGIQALEAMGDFIAPADPASRYVKQGVGNWHIHFDRANSAPISKEQESRRGNREPMANSDAKRLVSEFYQLWASDDWHLVTKHELFQSQRIIDRMGCERAFELLPKVVKLMKKHFPDARAFGATGNYWNDAEKASRRRQTAMPESQRRTEMEDQQRASDRAERRRKLRDKWSHLSDQQQNRIREKVATTSDPTVRRFIAQGKFDDPLVEWACFAEMQRMG